MNKSDADKAEFDLLTMINTGGARRNQSSDLPRDGVVFDALELLQTNSTLYKVITEHKIEVVNYVRHIMTYITFRLPARVVTVRGDSVAFEYTL